MKNIFGAFLFNVIIAGFFCACQPTHAKSEEPMAESKVVSTKEIEVGYEVVFKNFEAHNGVKFKYAIIYPEGYKKEKTYPALLAFSSMELNQNLAEDMIGHFFGQRLTKDWIVVVPLAPKDGKNGWMNHPAHHALNDLMDFVKKDHAVEGDKFHMFGYKKGGIPAETYSIMSRKYVQSLTLVSYHYWDDYDERNFNEMAKLKLPITLISGDEDEKGRNYNRKVEGEMNDRDIEINVVYIEGDDFELPSLKEGKILQVIQDNLH